MPITHDASFVDSLPANVAVQFLERVATSPNREAFRYPVGESWESLTWQQAGDEVARLAAGLLSLGIQPEQRVGIASGTRYEWILADLAIMCAGAATTTVYPTHQRGGHGLHPGRLRVPRGLRRGRRARSPRSGPAGPSCPTWARSSPSPVRPTATG